MTAARQIEITLAEPGDLLAALPHVLGFHPADSLVVLGLQGPRATELGITLRADLPPHVAPALLAQRLLTPLTERDTCACTLIVVGANSRAPDDDLPYRKLVGTLESVFVDNGVLVVHQLWLPSTTAGVRWHCYDDANCTGLLPDPEHSRLAGAKGNPSVVVFESRENIVATLAPDPPEELARRAAELHRRNTATESSQAPPSPTSAGLAAVDAAVAAAAAGPPTLTEPELIALAEALTDHRIRDLWLDFEAITDLAAAERLWSALVRRLPAPELAEPASLLGFYAYARGDGVLAGIALDRAMVADPGHELAVLLRKALGLGVAPNKVRAAGIRAAAGARRRLAEEGQS